MKEVLRTEPFRGLETAWLESGSPGSPILLLLHGFPDSPLTWEAQVAHFATRFQVIRPYARGAYPSAAARSLARYGTQAGALDLLQILGQIDPLGERKVFCVGHDLGAVHAWAVASLLGSRLQRLVLVNGMGLPTMLTRWTRVRQHLKSWYIYGMQVPGLAELALQVAPHRMLRLAHQLGALPVEKRLSPIRIREWTLHPLRQYRQFVREIPTTAMRQLPRLRTPVLLLWGSRDAFLLPPTAEEWEPFAADVTTRILPAGHWIHRERAAEVNRLIDDFFARTPRRGGNA
jgi:pimeloyl-ACP methyl ester carboxylesterase